MARERNSRATPATFASANRARISSTYSRAGRAPDPMSSAYWTTLARSAAVRYLRSEEHTSELQSRSDLVCRLLLEKKKKRRPIITRPQHQSFALQSNSDHL